ncbi:putative ABC transporter permease [Bifidobacterium choloepi]|nr:putative ABC transporter permease [Bifidobacterium choloepi]
MSREHNRRRDAGEPRDGNRESLHGTVRRDELGYFRPRTWFFWRTLIICLCYFSIVGHWCELPYCTMMNHFFGIVADDYAVWHDPWYFPYWVYGIGAVVMTLVIEPLKEWIVRRRKTNWGALLETFVIAFLLAAVLETGIGLIINQPDQYGIYPYWDNSVLPGNILGQGWIVNDFFIGLLAVAYVWLFYPVICRIFMHMKPVTANVVFAVLMVLFAVACIFSYVPGLAPVA